MYAYVYAYTRAAQSPLKTYIQVTLYRLNSLYLQCKLYEKYLLIKILSFSFITFHSSHVSFQQIKENFKMSQPCS